MFKLAGFLLLIFGCTGFGINKVAEERQRIRELREISRIIVRIQNEMVYGKRTLPEIGFILGTYAEEPYRSAFISLGEKWQKSEETNLACIWKNELEAHMHRLPLTEEEKEILLYLPAQFGLMDETQQAAGIGQSLDMLSAHSRKAEAEYENKARVIMSISVMAGLFIGILLL